MDIEIRDKIARLALSMMSKHHYFKHRHGIEILQKTDSPDGSQPLYITKENNILIYVNFRPSYNSKNSIYRARMYTDDRKDYMPMIDRGINTFCAESVNINPIITNETISEWEDEVKRLSKPHESLEELVSNGFGILIVCETSGGFCGNTATISNSELKNYLKKSATLEQLKNRIICSKCNYRNAAINAY